MAGEEISSRSVRQKRGCEEMRIHFFTAPFCVLRKGGFIAEYNRKGDIGRRCLSRNVISSEVEKSSLPCGYPCQCENENQRFLCFVSLLYHVGRLWVCQKDPSAALGMTKRGADGFSLVFRSLPSIRFFRCVPL